MILSRDLGFSLQKNLRKKKIIFKRVHKKNVKRGWWSCPIVNKHTPDSLQGEIGSDSKTSCSRCAYHWCVSCLLIYYFRLLLLFLSDNSNQLRSEKKMCMGKIAILIFFDFTAGGVVGRKFLFTLSGYNIKMEGM